MKTYISFLDFRILKKPCHMKKIDDLFFPPRTIKKGAVNVGSLSVKNYQVLKVMPYGISCKLTRKLVPRHTKWSQHISEIAFELFIILPSMVFCYQNCSDLLWEKIVLVIEKKLLKFEAEGREFAKFLRSLEQFIQTVKGQNNFW